MYILTMNPIDTIANALIPLMSVKGKREITYCKVKEYEQAVIKKFKKLHVHIFHVYIPDIEEYIIDNYSKYFYTKSSETGLIIGVKNNISADDLRDTFRINIPLHAIKAYACYDALYVLFK